MTSPPNGYRVTGINWTSPVAVENIYGPLYLGKSLTLVDAIQNGIDSATADQRIVFQGGIQGESWLVSGPATFTTAMATACDDKTVDIELVDASPIFNTQDTTTYVLQVDGEFMFATANAGNNHVTVNRGVNRSTAAPHAAGAVVNIYTISN